MPSPKKPKTKDNPSLKAVNVSPEQSQKLLHTMLMMAVGSVAFIRGLFTDDSFVDQRFVPRKFEQDYDPQDPTMRSDSIKLKTVARGKSPQADVFLDWIDKGVLDAIKKNYLRGLTLGIFLDETRPEELQEVYSFFFECNKEEIHPEVNEDESGPVTLLKARQELQQFMRRLIVITQGLDNLPEKKFITMSMLFSDSCPAEYQPEGFKDACGDATSIIRTRRSNQDTYAVGALSTGPHKYNIPKLIPNVGY